MMFPPSGMRTKREQTDISDVIKCCLILYIIYSLIKP